MAGAIRTHMSIAEFEALDDETQKRYELVRGELIETMAPRGKHSRIQLRLGTFIIPAADQLGLWAGSELDCDLTLDLNEPILRRPDLAVHPKEDWIKRSNNDERSFAGGPMLVIEIASPGQSFDDLTLKLDDFFAAGTIEAWIVSPTRRAIQVLTNAGTDMHEFRLGTTLTSECLPGMQIELEQLF